MNLITSEELSLMIHRDGNFASLLDLRNNIVKLSSVESIEKSIDFNIDLFPKHGVLRM